jgi:hypothetical protein
VRERFVRTIDEGLNRTRTLFGRPLTRSLTPCYFIGDAGGRSWTPLDSHASMISASGRLLLGFEICWARQLSGLPLRDAKESTDVSQGEAHRPQRSRSTSLLRGSGATSLKLERALLGRFV